MTLKSDAKIFLKTGLWFQYGTKNLVNFQSNTQTSENFTSMGPFGPKYIRFELKNAGGISFMTLNCDAKLQ